MVERVPASQRYMTCISILVPDSAGTGLQENHVLRIGKQYPGVEVVVGSGEHSSLFQSTPWPARSGRCLTPLARLRTVTATRFLHQTPSVLTITAPF